MDRIRNSLGVKMLENFVPYHPPMRVNHDFLSFMKSRRSVREFSSRPVPREILLSCIEAAGTAPSGANSQPWFFALIESQDMKDRIRMAAEKVENQFYHVCAPEKWLEDLKPLGTNEKKPYLSEAGALIAVFSRRRFLDQMSYYPIESTGIATGILITALHHAGLSTLTHTPSPMGFLNDVLDLDQSYRPYMIIVAGYAKSDARVPVLTKKPREEIIRCY